MGVRGKDLCFKKRGQPGAAESTFSTNKPESLSEYWSEPSCSSPMKVAFTSLTQALQITQDSSMHCWQRRESKLGEKNPAQSRSVVASRWPKPNLHLDIYRGKWQVQLESFSTWWSNFWPPLFPFRPGAVGMGNWGEDNKHSCLFRHNLSAASAEL